MSDPKITRLSNAIAEAIAALIDIANSGEPVLPAPPSVEIEERPTTTADVQPAARKRQAKSASAGDASSSSAEEASSTTVVETKAEPEQKAEPIAETTVADTLADAQMLAVELAKAKGRAALVDVLSEFGLGQPGQGVSKLKPEQIADFCDVVRQALAA